MPGHRCARVGCGRPAVARFGFDSVHCLVWLDTLDDRSLGAGVLCVTHADRLTPPRGWHVQDLRVPAPQLWADRPVVASGAPDVGRHESPPVPTRERAAQPAAEALSFETAMPVVPASADREPELDHLLDARTPLLARAFDAAREPRARA